MSRFGQLPEIFEYVDPEFRAFTYDSGQRNFSVGGETLALDSPDLEHDLLFPPGKPITAAELLNVPTVFDVSGHPITTPKLFSWLSRPDASGYFQQTADVMRDAFSELDNIKLNTRQHKAIKLMGFSCSFLREGHVTLTVLGSCACLGTDPLGDLVDSHDWDTGFVEMAFHNADTPTQYISLLAGLGHLATLCKAESD
ncbi:MAG: hypothetical protein ACREGF_00515 [Candidatus Saccharimonadales bacterium]